MEQDYEGRQRSAKVYRAKEVYNATQYLTNALWYFATDKDAYNFTRAQFEDQAEASLRDYVTFINEAVADVKYDGTILGWDEAWTMPNAILFTVSIMTVVGKSNQTLLFLSREVP